MSESCPPLDCLFGRKCKPLPYSSLCCFKVFLTSSPKQFLTNAYAHTDCQ